MFPKGNRERLDDILEQRIEDQKRVESELEEPLLTRRNKFSSENSGRWWHLGIIAALVWSPVYSVIAFVLIFTPLSELFFFPIFGNRMISVLGWYVIWTLILWRVLYQIDLERE